VFWYFKNCIEGIIKACEFFKLPVVSGNVSFYNESPKSAVYPTPTIGMIGIIDDIKYVCTQYFKNEADVIVLLGDTKEEFGGSEYLKQVHHLVRGDAPALDLSVEKAVGMCAYEAIKEGIVHSAHDCSEGGLAVCIAESCISDPENMIGAVIDNLDFGIREDAVLFAESQSRIVLSCSGGNAKKIKEIASRLKAPFRMIGKVGGSTLKITKAKEAIIDISIKEIHKSWAFSLERLIESGV
jgi:phosphoribosylformylglycinamidine synthase subunit PurL